MSENRVFSEQVPSLLVNHFDHLHHGSGIAVEVIRERGYRSILSKAELRTLGFSPAQCEVPGLLIPLWAPDGSPAGYQCRPDNPRLNRKGKPIKYETPTGAGLRMDVPPRCRKDIGNSSVALHFTEGAKKADAGASHGLCTVNLSGVNGYKGKNEFGAVTVLADFDFIALKGREAYIDFDSDIMDKPQIKDACDRLEEILRRKGTKVQRIYFPSTDGQKVGLDDYLLAHTVEELERLPDNEVRAIAASVARYEPQSDAHLTEIVTTGRHLRDITGDALKALYQANDPPHIFRRSNALTRIGADEKGRPFVETLTEAALRGKLARAANFVRLSEKGGAVAMTPPLDVTRDIESLGRWDFPPLQGITESPVFRRDGTVLTEPGYDAPTGLFYAPAPGMRVPPIPDAPTQCELKAAIELVIEVLCDFPFDSEASRTNAYGALIAPVVRPAIEGLMPLPIIDKPQPGCGASLIVDTISLIATGRLAATMGVPQHEEEWEKKLSSHLLAGRSFCAIDNIEGKLHSDTLSRYLTSAYVSIRPLGRSADIILPNNMTFIATGNNIGLGGDMPRRCYWIRLDAGVAKPWMREVTFKHPELREWIAANRGAILAAILTIARAWVSAGRPTPEGLKILGGFENYCRTIGGILSFMGRKDFLANLMEMYDKMDADTPQWEGFLEMWSETIGAAPVNVAEIVKHLNASEGFAATLPDSLATRDERDYNRRVGNALAKQNEVRLPNGLMVKKAGKKTHAITWAVVSYDSANSPNSPPFRHKGELDELAIGPMPREELSDSLHAYTLGPPTNSLNSPLGTKTGELGEPSENCRGEYAEKGQKPDATAAPVDEAHCAVCGAASVYVFDPDDRPLCEAHAPPEVEPKPLLEAEPETTEPTAASETLTESDPKVALLALGERLGYPEGIMFSSSRGLTIAAGEAHWRKFVEGASLEEVKIALQNALKMEEVLA